MTGLCTKYLRYVKTKNREISGVKVEVSVLISGDSGGRCGRVSEGIA